MSDKELTLDDLQKVALLVKKMIAGTDKLGVPITNPKKLRNFNRYTRQYNRKRVTK